MSVTSCFLKICKNFDKFGGGSTYIAVSVERLVQASTYRGDALHDQLKGHETVYCHRNCISTYTSKTHIKRYLSKNVDPKPNLTSSRRSEEIFSFRKHCLFCGEECISARDSQNPNRWRRVIQCRTADCGPTQKSFQDAVLET